MSNNYWIKRFTEEENRINELSKEQVKEAKRQYDIALKNVNQKIYEFYAKYAKDNNISMYEAKQRFNKKELKEFKMSLSEYIRKGKSLNMSSDNSIIKELKNVSSRVHIERLEALKMEIKAEIDLLAKTMENNLDKHLREVYRNTYYRSAYNIQKGLDKFSNIEKLNPDLIESLVYKPWTKDNTNWSKRIWGNDSKLVNTLHTNLTQNIITGKPLKEVIDTVAERFNVEKNIASRLIMTESAAYHSKAKEKCLKDLGCEKYEVIATLDDRTSSICRSMDSKVFDMKDYQVGVTAPPFHVNCRTVTAPYYDKIDGDINLRASRTEDDDYELVDVKDYQDWYDRYVEKPHYILHANDDKNYKDTEDEKYKKRIGDFYFLKKVDKIDYNIAKEIFSEYEPNMINLKYENAIVIKADGSVYAVLGGENFVDTTVLGDLTGAYITHNHPKKYTEFSFSNEDINSFINDKLEYLKGIDYKYEYELSRDLFESNEASTNPSEWANFENVRHEYVIGLASGRNIRYRRKKYE